MNKTKKIVFAGVSLLLCLLLPFLTGQIPQIGSMLSPMHIPVLICGFICGWPYGFLVGLVAPLLRFFLFGMPPLFPVGIAMSLELATYGIASGILYKIFPKNNTYVYFTLIISMLIGRIVWGIAMYLLMTVSGNVFTWQMFVAGAFITAVPGIILHILLVPIIVIALKKAGFMQNE